MVIELIVKLVLTIVQGLIDLLPPAGDLGLSAPSGIVQGYSWLDSFLPVHETLSFVGILGVVYVGVLAFRALVTLWHLIPIIG